MISPGALNAFNFLRLYQWNIPVPWCLIPGNKYSQREPQMAQIEL